MTDGTLQTIKNDFERVAQLYTKQFCKLFELDEDNGWWVADEIGGVYCNGDLFMIAFAEMKIVVDNQIQYDAYMEYVEYCEWANEFGQPAPNLHSWMMGCPRHSKESMQRLRDLKREFEFACENAKNAF